MRWIVAALLVAAAAAQDAGVRVTGIVRDAAMGSIRNAQVRLIGRNVHLDLITASDGRFRFDAVTPGRYVLEVSASWFTTRKLPVVVAGTDVDLGSFVLEIPCMHCEPPIDLSAPEPDCWDAARRDAESPVLAANHVARLATVKPLPVTAAEGVTQVRILVTPSGLVGGAAAVGGSRQFAAAALAAVRQWRFPPGQAFFANLTFRSSRGRVSLTGR